MMENLTDDFIREAVDIVVASNPNEERIFFLYWAWWEAVGKPNYYLGYKTLVLCPKDNQWHTPQEIKKKGWDRSEDEQRR